MVQNGKVDYLTSADNIAMWFYHSLAGFETVVSTVQSTAAKTGWVSDCHVTPNGLSNSIRVIIILLDAYSFANIAFILTELNPICVKTP